MPYEPAKADPLEPLVRRYLLSGDEEAMDGLVARTRPKLLAVARGIGAPQDAEDAVQGAYMALLRKRGSDLEAPVMPWLLTTVIRLAYRRKAKQGRQRDLAQRLAQPRHGAPPAADEGLLAAEREILVRAAVARLPATYRDAVVLKHLEGLSAKDAAALLEISDAALRTRLHRATRLLQGRMSATLLGLLLAVPWAVADGARKLGPLTRPLAAHPLAVTGIAAAVLVGAVLLGAVALGPQTFDSRRAGSAVAPVAPARSAETVGPHPTPPPRPEPIHGRQAVVEAPPFVRPERPAPRVPPAPETPDEIERAETAPRPDAPHPEVSSLPGALPIGSGAVASRRPPPGMVPLKGGHVRIGTQTAKLGAWLAGRPPEHKRIFVFETPRHDVFLRPYFIGRYEVTSAQYLVFLREHVTTRTTHVGDTLESVAAAMVGQSEAARADERQVVWRQLYRANKGHVWRALGERMKRLFVVRRDRTVDEDHTAQALRRTALPAGLALSFYDLAPPSDWPDDKPPAGREDHPVRFVSYDDAERFAEWAGMHIPTEAEWEWAARGPDGRAFPWGDERPTDAKRVNWGGKVTDAQHEPTTLPVASHNEAGPNDGRSWCGVAQMCGNVAEWTSSWFHAYPGQRATQSFLGDYVKVIRGGTAVDLEALVLRAACRNWVGAGPNAPPYPENGFEWVGLRLAAWRRPGLDHVPPLMRRVLQDQHLERTDFDTERFAAFVSHGRIPSKPDVAPKNHVYVRTGTQAVVFVPVTSFLRPEGRDAMRTAWRAPAAMRGTSGRLRGIAGRRPTWVLGALHTDLALHDVQVASETKAAGTTTRGRRKPPRTKLGTLPAGTYLLVAWHDRVALTTPSLAFRCFLPRPDASLPSIEVRLRRSKVLGSPTLKPTLETGEGDLDFDLPFGGRGARGQHAIHVRVRLPFKPGYLYGHGPWLRSR